MRFFEKIKVIERVDQLIRMKATGSARDLARKTNLSKTTIYEILDTMKNLGAEIDYCTSRRSYYYTSNKTLRIGFKREEKIFGGKKTCPVFSDILALYLNYHAHDRAFSKPVE